MLFYLGSSLWDLEKYKDALSIYKELIRAYPDSKWIPDAYLAFGEYYFDKADLDRALMAYKKVSEYPDSEIYPYGLYKQAWCYFNLHEWKKAKDKFREVIALADMEKGTTGRKIQIRKEALNDFTLTYSHEGSAKDAPRIFTDMAPEEAHKLLVNLAAMYFDDGKDKKAVILYRWLINKEKCSSEIPFYQGRIVDAASRVGNKRYTVIQVRELVRKFEEVKRCVKNPDERQKARIKEAEELAEVTLRRLAGTWYKEAKETKQKETFEYAQELFGDYLDLFPKSKDAYDIRFAYAELLFHRLARFERAAVEYGKLVQKDLAYLKKHKKFPKGKVKKGDPSPPGTYFCDAAYKSMQAHREIMKKSRRKEKKRLKKEKTRLAAKAKKAGKNIEKMPIPKYKKRFIAAAEIFLDYCPKDEDILDVKYDIAKTYYDYYHLDESIERFDEITKDFPESELAVYAANLVLDALYEREDFDSLNKYARKYYKNQRLMKNEKLHTYLSNLIPKIAFKRIEGLEQRLRKAKKGNKPLSEKRIYAKVAYAYIKFWREFPKHELADEALFDAGIKYEQAELLDKARKARQLLIDQYPKSDLVPGTIFNLAENSERLTDFDKAAELYEQYARTYKKMKGLGKAVSYKSKSRRHRRKRKRAKAIEKPSKKEKRFKGNRRTWNLEDAKVALLNAGIYREALHQYKRAISDRMEYVKLFPNSKEAPQVYYSLGLLYERLGRLSKAAEVFKGYYQRYMGANLDRAIASHMKRYVVLSKRKRPNRRELKKELETTLSLYNKYSRRKRKKKKKLLEAAEAAAHAAFIMAEPTYKEYIRFHFTRSRKRGAKAEQKHFKKQLAQKVKLFKKVEKIYTAVAKRKQAEWAIAALYKIGRAYENFAETFYRAPLPKGLTPEQLDLYKSTLRNMGQPYEDKAVAHFEAAVKKGSELGFYSRFTQLALKKLQHYRPMEYPREDLGFKLGVVSDPASRSPLLLGLWDDVKKHPEELNQAPLTFKREGEPEEKTTAAPTESRVDKTPEPKKSPVANENKGKDEEPKAEPEMADPASDVLDEDEPEDGF